MLLFAISGLHEEEEEEEGITDLAKGWWLEGEGGDSNWLKLNKYTSSC